MILHLDTHVVIRLYAGERERFPSRAHAALDHARLVYSPVVELEVQYLHEIGRITAGPEMIFPYLADRIGLAPDDTPYVVVARAARALSWTKDPFDRLITAAAVASNHPLLTRDQTIRDRYAAAFWDEE
ncbi:MAG: PIN domain-containing protein [Spirochaeta sp.]|jgi:PIN domain nuclease of toxin-antitoxin system|nr:PIN domain-containing protein [Spirochaeta sp.]